MTLKGFVIPNEVRDLAKLNHYRFREWQAE
jgi:hypothetical protein